MYMYSVYVYVYIKHSRFRLIYTLTPETEWKQL